MIVPIYYTREDTCPLCNKEKSLEIYDKFNNPIRFSTILDFGELERLKSKQLRYMRCKNCESEFEIDFTGQDRIPKALEKSKREEFIRNYKKLCENKI